MGVREGDMEEKEREGGREGGDGSESGLKPSHPSSFSLFLSLNQPEHSMKPTERYSVKQLGSFADGKDDMIRIKIVQDHVPFVPIQK
jgi:hypothetical protein